MKQKITSHHVCTNNTTIHDRFSTSIVNDAIVEDPFCVVGELSGGLVLAHFLLTQHHNNDKYIIFPSSVAAINFHS